MTLDRRSFIGASSGAVIGLGMMVGASVSAEPIKPGFKPDLGPGERLDARSQQPAVASDMMAHNAVNLRYENIDRATIEKAKLRVLDLVGCAIGGAPAHGNAALANAIASGGGKPEASLIGYDVKAPVAQVAMANGVISRSYDFEVMTVKVGDRTIASHHSPATCMSALAFAEAKQASGRDFLTALIMADDMAARLLAASGLDFFQGWDGAPVYSALPVTGIAARFLGLDALQTRDAFGISVDQIAGSVQNIWDGATDWKLPQGLVSRNAVLSAELAKGGWVGLADPLLAPYGFFAQYTAGCVDPAILTADLGKVFYAEEYFKPYPSCAATHPTLECALALREAHKLNPSQIKEINILIGEKGLSVFVSKPFEARRDPHCDANFSHQFQAVNAFLHGSMRQEHYAFDAIRSKAVTDLVARSSLGALPKGETGVVIEVVTNDGRKFRQEKRDAASHHPTHHISTHEEIVAKFRQQVAFSGYVKPAAADAIIDRINRIDQERNIADLMKLITQTSLG